MYWKSCVLALSLRFFSFSHLHLCSLNLIKVSDVEKRRQVEKNCKHIRVRLESEPEMRARERHVNYIDRVCEDNMRGDKVLGRTN